MNRGLHLRRQPAAQEGREQHEEKPSAVEPRERDDVQHPQVHRDHPDELEERGGAELGDGRCHEEDLDRSANRRWPGLTRGPI